jgi:hypothetical protein
VRHGAGTGSTHATMCGWQQMVGWARRWTGDPCPRRWAGSGQLGRGGLLAERNKVGHGDKGNGGEGGSGKENGRRRDRPVAKKRPKGTGGL